MSTLRAAREHDLDSIVELAIALGRQHADYDPRRFRLDLFGRDERELGARYRAFFVEQLERDDVALIVAPSSEGAIDGYVYARLEDAAFLDLVGPTGWIHDLFVHERGRGQRLGARLLDAGIAALRERGATEILLAVAPRNERARRIFETRGFVPTMVEMGLREPHR